MNRENTLDEGMYARPQEKEGLTFQPFTMAIGQVLEEKGNRFAKGGKFTPKMGELNELMFVMTHDIETVLAVPENDWRKEIIRFASTLDNERIEAIQEHTNKEIEKTRASEAKPRGKRKVATGG